MARPPSSLQDHGAPLFCTMGLNCKLLEVEEGIGSTHRALAQHQVPSFSSVNRTVLALYSVCPQDIAD
jgi:hypothetical protein